MLLKEIIFFLKKNTELCVQSDGRIPFVLMLKCMVRTFSSVLQKLNVAW